MICAPLWQVAEKGKPAPLKILNVQKLLGQEPTKSRVVPPPAGVCNRCIVVDLCCNCEACSLDAPGVVTPDTAPDISEPT